MLGPHGLGRGSEFTLYVLNSGSDDSEALGSKADTLFKWISQKKESTGMETLRKFWARLV